MLQDIVHINCECGLKRAFTAPMFLKGGLRLTILVWLLTDLFYFILLVLFLALKPIELLGYLIFDFIYYPISCIYFYSTVL